MSEYWLTKEGHKIAYVSMDDTHLANSIAMVERNIINQEDKLERVKTTLAKLKNERLRRLNAKKAAAKEARIVRKPATFKQEGGRKFREG